MKRRSRDRRGRFLKGHAKVRARTRGRRSSSTRTKAKRRKPRASNPPKKRRRSRTSPRKARRRNAPKSHARRTRTKHVYHKARRRNPPNLVKTILVGAVVGGVGFAGAKLIPMAIIKLAKKPEWGMGWKPVGLAAGSTAVVALIGYGIGRLLISKKQATLIAIEIGIGGMIATGHEAYKAWKARPAPRPAPAVNQGGQAGFSPAEIRDAVSAATLLNRGGQGGFSPAQYAGATTGGALMTGAFTAEKNF